MATKKIPYLNQFTGEVVVVSKQHGKKLNEDWQKIEFTTNEKGERVMRMQFNGVTVDVSENEEVEAKTDGIGSAK